MSREVAIIGAGIVGMSVALELQRDGMQVTVFDPEEPGSGASFGNAGVIATELSLPIATPDVLRRVPRMLLDPYGPLVIRPFYLPRIATWLGRLALASRPGKMVATARALGALLDLALKSFRRLAADTRADDLVIERGRLAVYATEAGYLGSTGLREEWQRRGVAFRTVSVGEVREMEPALAPVFMHGLFLPGGAFVVDPQAIVRRFARTFSDRGGRIVRAPVGTLRRYDGRRELVTPAGVHRTDVVVVAAGAWSGPFAGQLGISLPLDTERGYHVMFPATDPTLSRPVLWADRYLHLVPMAQGVRMTTGVEFAGLNAPGDFRRVRRQAHLARRLVPGLAAEPDSEWLGFRPSLPDSLPVIGSVPGHGDVYFCFGHHHLGLTLGPLSGSIVADLVAGRPPPVDMEPYAVCRAYT